MEVLPSSFLVWINTSPLSPVSHILSSTPGDAGASFLHEKQVWVTLLFKMCEWLPSLLWSKDSVRSSHYRPSSCIACPLPLSNLNAARWKYSQLLWAQRSLSSTPLEAPCACPCLTQGMHPASTELLQSQFHFSSTRFVAASVPGCSFHHLILGLERLEREGHQDLTAGSKPGSKQIAA